MMGGMSGGHGSDGGVQAVAFITAWIAIFVCWPFVRTLIPIESQFAFADLVREHWAHRDALEPWLSRRWAWLALHRYPLWFALAMLPGIVAIAMVQGIGKRTAWPLLHAPLGWFGGSGIGYILCRDFQGFSWPAAVMMPATFAFLGGAIGARLAAMPRRTRHIRGTKIRTFRFGRLWRLWARATGRVTLAGVPLSRDDETMHVAAIGATGSGKSTALRALMSDAMLRGDRHIVADPEGTAMDLFMKEGDIILNPFHPECARWDLLAEIEAPSDYAFLAASLLPHIGRGDQDQWITYAQQLLAGALENFVTLDLGGSDAFAAMMGSGKIDELKTLCAGTPASRYFEPGGERMLASILGTLAPAVGHLQIIGSAKGSPFSVRRWIREGQGSLWIPYTANQIAALRGLASCWMNIAILETLSLEPSAERRIWFHVDELDALGRIEGLQDAQARLRKFGGCVAVGFQSFAQVKQIYGEGAQTIVENCGNLLLLRSGASEDGGTAKLASELIGDREVERENIGCSRSYGRYPSRSMSLQKSGSVENVVLTSEIMALSNLEGFVCRASLPYWKKMKFTDLGGRAH